MPAQGGEQSGDLYDDVAGRAADFRGVQCSERCDTRFGSVGLRARYIHGPRVQRGAEGADERESRERRNGASESVCEGEVCGWGGGGAENGGGGFAG